MGRHQRELDALDQELEEFDKSFGQENNQQLAADPGSVVPPAQEEDGQGQDGMQEVDVITSVDEFEHGTQPGEPVLPDGEESSVMQAAAGRKSWKQEYELLENRYIKLRQASDNFKFEARQQTAQLQEALLALQEQNDTLKEKIAEYEASSSKVSLASLLSEDDAAVLGESTIEGFQKAVEMAVSAQMKPLQMELLQMKKAERDRLKGQIQANKNEAYTSFEMQLGQLVPNFRTVNRDKQFIEWLRQESPYTGIPRINYFRKAEQTGDVERVAQFFIEYQQLVAAPDQLLSQSVTPTGRGGGNPAPSRTPSDGAAKPKVFSIAFINKFYDDDIKGVYKGREPLRDQLDKEIDLALSEGRVI